MRIITLLIPLFISFPSIAKEQIYQCTIELFEKAGPRILSSQTLCMKKPILRYAYSGLIYKMSEQSALLQDYEIISAKNKESFRIKISQGEQSDTNFEKKNDLTSFEMRMGHQRQDFENYFLQVHCLYMSACDRELLQ